MGKILIAGGTGFIGKNLASYLVKNGYSVNVLAREAKGGSQDIRYFKWSIENNFIDTEAFEGVTKIINLTGANISDKRWTAERKKEILESRKKPLELIYKYIKENDFKIDTLISSSAVGYYGAVTTDTVFSEESRNGSDFLATVCRQWEESALLFEKIGIRTTILRKGLVIGPDGGIYKELARFAKWGVNTSVGSGKQYLPWIDIRDLVSLYNFILKNSEARGVFNAVATEHMTMNELSKAMVNSFGKSSFLPNAPAFAIKLLFGEMSVMFLEGSRISNRKIKEEGFHFEFDTIGKSLLN